MGSIGEPANGEGNGSTTIDVDVLVVGAGFSGITAIDRFRKLGKTVKCFESGEYFGGVWHWNRYPGARVDSEVPFYQLNIPEVYATWSFSERFPDHVELRRYMKHCDKVLNLSKDTYFNAHVVEARRDEAENVWVVKTQQGHVARAKYLFLGTGLLHRTYVPDFPGASEFKGELHHTAAWPENFDARGKKIAVIGAGATGVQVVQELGREAEELTLFLRRPSYCLPMCQRSCTPEEQHQAKVYYPTLFAAGRNSAVGFPATVPVNGVFDETEEEREERLERMWTSGGFHFLTSTYRDTILNPDSNRVIYDFWRKKVCERLTDPEKNRLMAPETAPYYFGTKRTPLEQDYYEVLNRPHVRIHDLNTSPLEHFSPKGIVTADGTEHDFDTIVLATGFESFTGSLTRLGLKNKHGVDLRDIWADGITTYLGITLAGFPNCFMAYTPQAPTAFSNGPTLIEAQVEIIVDYVRKMEADGIRTIEPTRDAEVEYKAALAEMANYTLLPFTDSWWNGGNIPGKKRENIGHIGGIQIYEQQCRAAMDGWKGFEVVKAA